MEKIEKILSEYNIENMNVPLSYTQTIKQTLYKKKNNTVKKYKFATSTIALILIIGSITTYAFTKMISLNEFGLNDNGINKALNNGYLQKIEMNPIIQNDTSVKIEYLVMDDIDLDIIMNIEFKEDISQYQGFNIPNLLITDEKNNQLFMDTEEREHEKSFATSMGWKVIEKDGKNIRQLLFLKSNNFPKSEILKLKFNEIILYNVNNGKPFTKKVEGEWEIEIQVKKEFSERKSVKYKVQNKDNGIIEIQKAQLLNTGFWLKFRTKEVIDENISIKLFDNKGNEYLYVDSNKMSNDEYSITYDMTQYDFSNNLIIKLIKDKSIIEEIKLYK